MKLLKSLASAFLMYSRIPMHQIAWKEENRRYALCFFPLIGMIIGILLLLWLSLSNWLHIGGFLKGVGSVLIPLLVTGGIHMDGFCDVTDAKASYADQKKKLEIMCDPHTGSFAILYLCGYLLLQTALFSEFSHSHTAIIVAWGYVLSRALSGIAAVTLKSAKNEGTLQNFVRPAHKKITIMVLVCTAALSGGSMLIISFLSGGLALLGAAGCFLYYKKSSYQDFGGITGDTAGWFLQICEIAVLLFAVVGEKIMEVTAL